MQNIFSITYAFLIALAFQSLFILFSGRNTLIKILPLGMFIVPISGIWEVVSHFPNLFTQTVLSWLDILIPLVIGDILGWIMGLYFKKLLNATKTGEGNYENDNNKTE